MDYPISARHAIGVFKRHRNSITIYTEDNEKDKKFYVTLFQRLLNGTGVIVNDVIPLGNCNSVMQACQKDHSPHPKLYIVDGDINLMTNPKAPQEHLHILNRYCIENFVIDKEAFYKVYDELDFEHDIYQIQSLIDYDKIVSDACNPLMELFHHFAASMKTTNRFTLKDCSQVVNGQWEIDKAKIDSEKKYVKDTVCKSSKVSAEEFDNEVNMFKETYAPTVDNMFRYVSAKDYIIPYVVGYTNKKIKQNIGIKKEAWKLQFAKYSDLNCLSGLKDAILKEMEC